MRSWWDAIVAAGVVPPPTSPNRASPPDEDVVPADLVEGDALRAYAVPDGAITPAPVCFLDGIQHWKVVGTPGDAGGARTCGGSGAAARARPRLRTAAERSRELAITHLAALPAAARRALEQSGVDIVDLPASDLGHPAACCARAACASIARAKRSSASRRGVRGAAGPRTNGW